MRQRWMRHRWRSDWASTTSQAPISPGAPSEITSSGGDIPREVRSRRNSAQAS